MRQNRVSADLGAYYRFPEGLADVWWVPFRNAGARVRFFAAKNGAIKSTWPMEGMVLQRRAMQDAAT